MLDSSDGPISLKEKMKYLSYQTLYENVQNRLCRHEEVSAVDFFTTRHEGSEQFVKKHRDRPTAYRCNSRGAFTGDVIGESTYLVVAGKEKVVLLLSPQDAMVRNLPFLSVFENGFFRPYLGCVSAYWQKHIEPEPPRNANVLSTPNLSPVYQ